MKTKHIIYASLFLLVLSVQHCQCKMDEILPTPIPAPEVLPPVTTIGANTFGCYVDGKLWLPFGSLMTPAIAGNIGGGYINISGARRHIDEPSSTISIIINNGVHDTGLYKLSFISDSVGRVYYYYEIKPNYDSNLYYVDTFHIGSLHILRLDSINHIMSGTFYFDAYNKYLNKTVKITDGRFDYRY